MENEDKKVEDNTPTNEDKTTSEVDVETKTEESEESKEENSETENSENTENTDTDDFDELDDLLNSISEGEEENPTEPKFFPKKEGEEEEKSEEKTSEEKTSEEKTSEEEGKSEEDEIISEIDQMDADFKQMETDLETEKTQNEKYSNALDILGDHPILGPLNEKLLKGEKVDIPDYIKKNLEDDLNALPNMDNAKSEPTGTKKATSLQERLTKRVGGMY